MAFICIELLHGNSWTLIYLDVVPVSSRNGIFCNKGQTCLHRTQHFLMEWFICLLSYAPSEHVDISWSVAVNFLLDWKLLMGLKAIQCALLPSVFSSLFGSYLYTWIAISLGQGVFFFRVCKASNTIEGWHRSCTSPSLGMAPQIFDLKWCPCIDCHLISCIGLPLLWLSRHVYTCALQWSRLICSAVKCHVCPY